MIRQKEVWVCPFCRAYKDIDQYSIECPYCGATFKNVKKRGLDYGKADHIKEMIDIQKTTSYGFKTVAETTLGLMYDSDDDSQFKRKGRQVMVHSLDDLDDRIKIGPYSTVMLLIAAIISFLMIMTPVYIESVFPRADNFELNAYMMLLVMGMIASSGMMVYIKVKERIRPEPIDWEINMEVVG